MLKNDKFDLSPEVYNNLREAMRSAVEELKTKESLYPQTLGEFMNQFGKILFTGDSINEAEMVDFMAPITQYLINKEVS